MQNCGHSRVAPQANLAHHYCSGSDRVVEQGRAVVAHLAIERLIGHLYGLVYERTTVFAILATAEVEKGSVSLL